MKPQTWLIAGATGLIGSALVEQLLQTGQNVRILSRRPVEARHGVKVVLWNPRRGVFDRSCLSGVDVIVQLAGANVGQRWTQKQKALILQSRLDSTHLLGQALSDFTGTWIQASAIGYYGKTQGEVDESQGAGTGFLADVVRQWENAARLHQHGSMRQAILRFGVVLSPKGGSLRKMLPVYRCGLGAALSHGHQKMSWIHLEDVVRTIEWVARNPQASGIFNVVAPSPCSNRDFSKALATALHRPHWSPNVPAWALRWMFGDMSSVLLDDAEVRPDRLHQMGFDWNHPDLDLALRNLLT